MNDNAAKYGGRNSNGSAATVSDIIPSYSGGAVSSLLSVASLGYTYQ